MKKGLAPIATPNATVLILGSFPGERSLADKQYYAHPQNQFWKILSKLCRSKMPVTYSDKLKFLAKNKIALWDVCGACEREGSLDSNIKSARPNDLKKFIKKIASIKCILLNGRCAENLYRSRYEQKVRVKAYYVPSSSPASTLRLEKKIIVWKKQILNRLLS